MENILSIKAVKDRLERGSTGIFGECYSGYFLWCGVTMGTPATGSGSEFQGGGGISGWEKPGYQRCSGLGYSNEYHS